MAYKTGFYKGRLGIGLSNTMGMGNGNPRYPLDINGDIRLTGDIINENGFSLLGNTTNGLFYMSNDNNVILTDSDANVGIGTTNPISKLSVYQGGITLDNPVATYTNASVAATANSLKPFEIRATTGSLAGDWGILRLRAGGGTYMSTCSFIDIVGFNSTDSTCIKFFTYNNERMRINSSGNVGIGVSNPSERLVVNTEYAQTKLVFGIGGNDYSTVMYIGGAGTQQRKLALISEPEGGWCRSNLHFCLNTAGDVSDATKENDSKMVIKNNGNVGIGTTSPIGMLSVGDSNVGGSDGNIVIGKNNGSGGTRHLKLGWNSAFDFCFGDYGSNNSASTWVEAFKMSYQAPANSLVIDSGGNVGIGTDGPERNLEIYKSSGDVQLAIKSGTGGSLLMGTHHNGRVYFHNLKDGRIDFGINNSVIMELKANGNVGIGTTSPFGKLDIKHSNWTQTPTASTMCDMLNLMVSSPSTTGENNMRTLLCFADGYRNNSATKDSYRVRCRMSGAGFDMIWNSSATETIGSNTSNNNFIFHRDWTAFMNKNVGIGTTDPGAKLEVNRETTAGVIAEFKSNTAGNSGIMVSPKNGSDGDGYIELRGGNSSSHGKHTFIGCTRNGSDTYNSNIVFKTRHNEGSYTYTSAAERMRIQYNGNVGIGTTSPGISLDVHGTYLGRYYNFGSCHDADKRNSFYIGRWDGTTTQSGVFLGMQLKVDTHDNMGYGSYDNQASIIFQTWGNNYSTSREIMEITANGYVRGINAFQNDSDDRIKHNEKNINEGLNVINKLQAKEYFKTSTLFDENGNIYDSNHNFDLNNEGLPIDASGEVLTDVNKEIGFIAQEVFEIDELKHAVREGNLVSDASGNKYKNKFGLSYEEIFVMNVVATQELYKENQELKTKVATLESELVAIKTHLGI